ncbi:transcription factor Pcc1 [Rhizopus microsporus var. microsporus]|uniref:Transcription factor Pcc1 n=1 Tax=Rhizopus microsporus var. microsporus TaxID=86635 RepID=A0A1X0QQN8_RHIZD|nr:transcription factor Pcc1 [Rhizopus microsporus var. microsporus]
MDKIITLEIPLPNERLATIAARVIEVDKELKADQVKRTISAEGNILKVRFDCYTTKMLRVSVNSFLEYLTMVTRTMEAFQ